MKKTTESVTEYLKQPFVDTVTVHFGEPRYVNWEKIRPFISILTQENKTPMY